VVRQFNVLGQLEAAGQTGRLDADRLKAMGSDVARWTETLNRFGLSEGLSLKGSRPVTAASVDKTLRTTGGGSRFTA
jgi:hypothetical protein